MSEQRVVDDAWLEQQIEKVGKARDKATREFDVQLGIITSLPSGLPIPKYVHTHGYCAVGNMKWEKSHTPGEHSSLWTIDTMEQQILQLLPPVTSILYKDSCTSFRPAGTLNEKERQLLAAERAEVTLVAPVHYKLESAYGRNPGAGRLTAKWWTCLGTIGLVQCEVDLAGEAAGYDDHHDRRGNHIVNYCWAPRVPERLHDAKVVMWWRQSKKEPQPITYHWEMPT